MNKQLTKKSIGIAASAALMASLALSTNALAAPGGDKGPPAADIVTCVDSLPAATHACVDTLQSVNAAILGATTVNPRDTNSLLNKVCEAHYKIDSDKFDDAAQKLWDISMTIKSKRKVSPEDLVNATFFDVHQARWRAVLCLRLNGIHKE